MTTSRFWIALAAAAVLLSLTLAVRSMRPGGGGAGEADTLDFSPTLKDMDGRDVRLADFSGKPLIINLWATWCGPCRLEMPQLVQLSAKYKDRGLNIIGISVDDRPEDVRAFAAEFKVNYPMLVGLGRDEVLAALGYTGGVPMSLFVNADGTVAHRMIGIATTRSWERRIEALF